jgi:hypothetical protein
MSLLAPVGGRGDQAQGANNLMIRQHATLFHGVIPQVRGWQARERTLLPESSKGFG